MGIVYRFTIIIFCFSLKQSFSIGDTIFIDNSYFIKHIVQSNETFGSISNKYNVSIKEIIEHNDIRRDLYYKQIIYIPIDTNLIQKKSIFKRVRIDTSSVNIALILPFYVSRNDTLSKSFEKDEDADNFIYERSKIALSFFQGAELAIDTIAMLGKKINVFIYDSENDSSKIIKLIESNQLDSMDLIIGPFYSSNLQFLSKKLNKTNIKIVSPLSRNVDQLKGAKNVFQINAPFKNQAKLLADHLYKYKDEKIVFVYQEKDIAYKSFISNLLRKNNIIHYENKIKFTHVDSIRHTFDSNQVVLIPSYDKVFVSKILGSLGSIDSSFTVYGLSNWKDFENLDLNNLMKLNVHLYDPYYTDKSQSFFLEFQKKYEKRYNLLIDKYSFLAYRLVFHFLTDYNQFEFERYKFNSGFVNTNLRLSKFENYDLMLMPKD